MALKWVNLGLNLLWALTKFWGQLTREPTLLWQKLLYASCWIIVLWLVTFGQTQNERLKPCLILSSIHFITIVKHTFLGMTSKFNQWLTSNIFKNFVTSCKNRVLRNLKILKRESWKEWPGRQEKRVLRAAHIRNTFSGENLPRSNNESIHPHSSKVLTC